LTALCDIAKGYLAFVVCDRLFGGEICPFVGGVFAVLGHIFPFYMKFKGGKGFASYAGMCLGISWKLFLAIVVISALITLITDYIALATLATVVYVPAWLWYISRPVTVVAMLVVLGILIFWKHRVNIQNIRNGTEIGLRKRNRKTA
jgi:glycerol-3-phosphate acyltransferase PlsY